MKICPKCQSTFSDDTLSFCLTDGTPLLRRESDTPYLSDEFSHEFSNAQTMADRASASMHSYVGPTNSQSEPPTQFFSVPSQNIPAGKRSRTLIFSLIGLIVLGGVGIGVWSYLSGRIGGMDNRPVEVIRSTEARKIASPLTPEQIDQLKKEVADFLQSWKTSIEKRDIEAHMRHYAKTLETFYRDSGKDQNHVRAERLKAMERYEMLSLDITNLAVTPESDRFATAIFDKSWVFRNKDRYSSGSVQQEIGLVKSDGRWFIVIEKDLQTYNINNRQIPPNAPADTNANQ